MYSISQNLKNVLKNRIKILISPILYETIDTIVDNLFLQNNVNKYFQLISSVQSSVRDLVRSVVIASFEEIDSNFKNSAERKSRYYVNKSNVPRTLITIVGEITFFRTYYQNKISNNKLFYVDTMFNLPKYDHYDPIIKGIAVNNTFNTSQAQSARDTSALINDITYFLDYSSFNSISRQSVYNWIKQ